MQRLDGRFIYSASDLNDYLECKRLTELEGLVARAQLARPHDDDEHRALLRRKGDEHEQAYLVAQREALRDGVVEFGQCEAEIDAYRNAERQTIDAMRRGAPLIYQATFFDGQFLGRADFLRRVDGVSSNLGAHSYEVIDTKLGLEAKPYYLVQLCSYSEHLERLQGCMPEFGYVVLGSGEERRFRLNEYFAYYRHLKAAFLQFASQSAFVEIDASRVYPQKCKHCSLCPWDDLCRQQRSNDDHLSLVAWMRRDQVAKFEAAGIVRFADLARATDEQRPSGMNAQTFVKLRRQASLQLRGRTSPEPIYELLAHEPSLGFEMLPQPVPGDVFFDMEGDPLFEPGTGLEYLFGCWLPDDSQSFRVFWGTDRTGEKQAFESFVDFVTARRRQYPAMHIYHYANYEKSALRRLAQTHATRENEVDNLLRAEVFVDLYSVVRQALAISEDGYGLKKLERFYNLSRETDVKKGAESIVMFERWMLERDPRILEDIEAYNRDDCRSTYLLREWLLERRAEAIMKFGIELPLRAPKRPGQACHDHFVESCKQCLKRRYEEREEERRSDLERALLCDVLPPQSEREYTAMNTAKRTRYLLGNLLAYHRREEKPAYWEYFDRCENVDDLLEFDRTAIGGLMLRDDVPAEKIARSKLFTYHFPDQIHKLAAGDSVTDPRTRSSAGMIFELYDERNELRLKTTASPERARKINELIPSPPPSTGVQRKAMARIGQSFLKGSLPAAYPATHGLLTSGKPRMTDRKQILQPEEVTPGSVSAVVQALDGSYLFVQGPPGSGKTTVGSQVICDLIRRGKRVGVTSNSHKAIHNLLHKVEECVHRCGGNVRGLYKYNSSNPESKYTSRLAVPLIESVETNEALYDDDYQLAGGTGWLFAREELARKFDYLFIDEAGQISLADALAMSLCAKNVVLLGDPSQLSQVSQGHQPLHVGDSILEHLLGDAQTVPPDRGILLDHSYRMHPQICEFISEAMYEGRLKPAEATRNHRIVVEGEEIAGLYYMPIEHEANGSSSQEEASAIVRLVALLHNGGVVVDSQPAATADGTRLLTDRDIIVVTPYNAQRRLITRKLRDAGFDIEVGTVDKFQGQEAAIVFYSMATSSGDDVPRDMAFLFERNRFNVAVSRARAASVLICSPHLLDVSCSTPEQMALANLLCAFAQRAWDKHTTFSFFPTRATSGVPSNS